MTGTCNGSGIIRDLRHGDTGEVYDCPGCDACSWYAFHDEDELDDALTQTEEPQDV